MEDKLLHDLIDKYGSQCVEMTNQIISTAYNQGVSDIIDVLKSEEFVEYYCASPLNLSIGERLEKYLKEQRNED